MSKAAETTNFPARPAAAQYRPRRSPKLIAAGVLAVVLGAVGFVALSGQLNSKSSVVQVTSTISRGETITAGQLGLTQVPLNLAEPAIAAEKLHELVGRTALVDLPEGAIPRASHIGDNPLPEGKALVGLRLSHGKIPASKLQVGNVVALVALSPTDPSAAQPITLDPTARGVIALAPQLLEDHTTYLVDLQVPEDLAHQVTQLSARGELAIYRVTGG